MNDNEKILKLINTDKKYQIFKSNKIVEPFLNGGLEFKNKSKTSIGFIKKDGQSIVDRLIEIFDISDKTLFKEKFKEAITGAGREENNMLTIWASSLCAFLCFYNVSNCPLYVSIKGIKYCFNEVHFEIQNKVLSKESNIDIVLVDRENKCYLFLESKFGEYLTNDSNSGTSSSYYPYFAKIPDSKLASQLTDKNDKGLYHYGIKQFLTHYIGLEHFTNDQQYEYHFNDSRHELFDFYNENKANFKIYLQEIILIMTMLEKKNMLEI